MTDPTPNLREQINGSLTEADYLKMVIGLAHQYKWYVAHFRPAMTSKGWRTAVQADAAGFPDLVLARRNEDGTTALVFMEIKRQKGKLTEQQIEWLSLLDNVPGVVATVCHPSDWAAIASMLK